MDVIGPIFVLIFLISAVYFTIKVYKKFFGLTKSLYQDLTFDDEEYQKKRETTARENTDTSHE